MALSERLFLKGDKFLKNYKIVYSLLMCLVFMVSGCSISDSISSSSDSSRSISRSSTSSSGPEVSEETRKAYVNDVSTYTEAVAESAVTADDFMRGLSKIAQKHGISDWESYEYTFKAIGQGLKEAGIPKDQVKDLPYLNVLISSNSQRLDWIKDAY